MGRLLLDLGTVDARTIEKFEQEAAAMGKQSFALAWVLAQGDDVIPIPGTKRVPYLEENAAAVDVVLTDDDLARLSALSAQAAGPRAADPGWINRTTRRLDA